MTARPALNDTRAADEAFAREREREQEEDELRRSGARIAALIEDLAALGGPPVRQRVGELVSSLVSLYGAGLARLMDILGGGRLDPDVRARLAADPLVSSLLVLHGLHPDPEAAAGGDEAPAYPRQPRSAEAPGDRVVQIDLARSQPVEARDEP